MFGVLERFARRKRGPFFLERPPRETVETILGVAFRVYQAMDCGPVKMRPSRAEHVFGFLAKV
jgi:hypothetical protein